MILAVDSSALALLINPAAHPPDDPETGQPVERAQERVEYFIATLRPTDTLVIPTPALGEVLVEAGSGGPSVLTAAAGLSRVRIRPYGERAAIETAQMAIDARAAGDKRGGSTSAWQKVKIDRQILAVARVEGVDRVYTDDRGMITLAKRLGMDVVSTWDLPLPPEKTPDLFAYDRIGASGSGTALSAVPSMRSLPDQSTKD